MDGEGARGTGTLEMMSALRPVLVHEQTEGLSGAALWTVSVLDSDPLESGSIAVDRPSFPLHTVEIPDAYCTVTVMVAHSAYRLTPPEAPESRFGR